MCSDLKSPMLQVLSNTSLKVFLSTTPNFCLGALRTPPVPPETLLFGLLLGCLHYYKCRHCKIWRNFWVPSPFKPNIFSFDSLLNTYFFMVPHQIPPPNPPPTPPPPPPLPDNTWTVSKKVFLAYSLLHIWNKNLVAFTTIHIINN